MNCIPVSLWILAALQPAGNMGTFDRPSIVIAYYRSGMWLKVVPEKKAALQAAREKGDAAEVAEFEEWGRASQELLHGQLEGQAPIDNILEALKPHLPAVARAAGVRAKVVNPAQGAGTVDVTGALIDVQKADGQTRKIVEQVREHRGPIRVH